MAKPLTLTETEWVTALCVANLQVVSGSDETATSPFSTQDWGQGEGQLDRSLKQPSTKRKVREDTRWEIE